MDKADAESNWCVHDNDLNQTAPYTPRTRSFDGVECRVVSNVSQFVHKSLRLFWLLLAHGKAFVRMAHHIKRSKKSKTIIDALSDILHRVVHFDAKFERNDLDVDIVSIKCHVEVKQGNESFYDRN